jgi:hypothetical protein
MSWISEGTKDIMFDYGVKFLFFLIIGVFGDLCLRWKKTDFRT